MHNRKPKNHKKQKTVIHSHRLVWCVLLGLICVFSQLSIHYYVIEIMQLCIMLFHTSWIFIISKSQNHEHLITKNTLYQLNLEGKKCHPAFLGDKNFRKDKSGNKPLDRYWQSYDQNIGGGGLVTKSCPTLVTPKTVAWQAPLSMIFSRWEYWTGLLLPSPGYLPNPGIKSGLLLCRKILYPLSFKGSPCKILHSLNVQLKMRHKVAEYTKYNACFVFF